MLTRRDFLQVAAATAAVTGLGGQLGRAASQQAIGQDQLLQFASKGQLTILHLADCHAQLKPLYYREPSLNLGVGEARSRLPHITGSELLDALNIVERSPKAATAAASRIIRPAPRTAETAMPATRWTTRS